MEKNKYFVLVILYICSCSGEKRKIQFENINHFSPLFYTSLHIENIKNLELVKFKKGNNFTKSLDSKMVKIKSIALSDRPFAKWRFRISDSLDKRYDYQVNIYFNKKLCSTTFSNIVYDTISVEGGYFYTTKYFKRNGIPYNEPDCDYILD